MYSPRFWLKRATTAALVVVFGLLGARQIVAQGKQAIIIMRPPAASSSASGCDGAAEINYQTVTDLKLNNEDEVRLANMAGRNGSSAVSRKDYEASAKSKLKDLFSLRWGSDGVLYAVSLSGQTPIPALPDNLKPQKNADQPLSSFYSVMLSGEAREGKQKRKLSLAVREVWKIYFVPDGAVANDTLFKHAAEEKNVGLWEAYLKKTNNYRLSEANAFVRDALVECARVDLENFSRGDYNSLDKARQRTARAKSVKDDDLTRQLAANVQQAQEKVDTARAQVEQLTRTDKWDEALAAATPIKMYLTTWPDLNKMYTHALTESHNVHLFKGEEALRGNQLETARDNCTTAWSRLNDSVTARKCVCEARNQIALRDSGNYRRQRLPKDAKALLEQQLADADCPQDSRLASVLREANCEYAQQLLAEARQLVVGGGGMAANAASRPAQPQGARRGAARRRGVAAAGVSPAIAARPSTVALKPISAQNKKDFRDARAKLVLAGQLCPEEAAGLLLDATNRRLSEYCLEEARKALQREDLGTAYVYLQSAQEYTPGDNAASGLLTQARENFQQHARVTVGVLFDNSSNARGGEQVLNEVAAEVESAATRAGLAQVAVLDRQQTASYLRSFQGERPVTTPIIIFSGTLLGADIRRNEDPRSVRSSYSYSNPQWEDADREHDATNAEYKRCVKTSGEANCGALANRVASLRANRDRYERNITEYYTYRETTISVAGGMRMSFRANDSVTRSTRGADTFEASVSQQCVQREGVHQRDNSTRDSQCSLPDNETYVAQMIDQIKSRARVAALSQLDSLPLSYYTRAKSAANRQRAVEDYLRFLFMTRDKSGSEAKEAQGFLVAFDPELKTDGVMR